MSVGFRVPGSYTDLSSDAGGDDPACDRHRGWLLAMGFNVDPLDFPF